MQYQEQAIVFGCEGEQLLGILCGPADGTATSGAGMVIVVGGPQYRAGSHRQFVLLARALAAKGHVTLRFDYRGMGDSTGVARDFEHVSADIHAAVGALTSRCSGLRSIALWGLCDGASACLLYLQERGASAAIGGICLLNPWVRSPASLARAQVKHYYARRLMQKAFWQRLARGDTGLGALREFGAKVRDSLRGSSQPAALRGSYQERMAGAMKAFPGSVLMVLSGDDLVAREFLDHARATPEWKGLLGRPGVEQHHLPEADHTFSTAAWRQRVEEMTASWLEQAVLAVPAPIAPLEP